MNFSFNRTDLLLVVLLLLLAGGLRFHSLGAWSFFDDETYSTEEALFLFEGSKPREMEDINDTTSQFYRLPRLNILSYGTLYAGYKLFGTDEFGSRVLMALFGTLTVGLVYLLGKPLLGTASAFSTSLLMTFWTEHLFVSQQNRFYAEAVFFSTLVYLLAGHVVLRRSFAAAIGIGPAAVAMVLCHSMNGLHWAVVLGAAIVAWLWDRKRISGRIIGLMLLWSVLLFAILVFHIVPLAKDWNNFVAIRRYDSIHIFLASIIRFNWAVAILMLLGGILCLTRRTTSDVFWGLCGLSQGLILVAMPPLVVFFPWYIVLFAFPLYILAGTFVGTAAESIFGERNRLAQCSLVVLLSMLSVQDTISYFQDGSRYDARGALHYVRDHWKEGDRMFGHVGYAYLYFPEGTVFEPESTKWKDVFPAIKEGERLWVLVASYRGEYPGETISTVTEYAVFQKRFGKKRFDYPERNIDVFLYTPPGKKNPNENSSE